MALVVPKEPAPTKSPDIKEPAEPKTSNIFTRATKTEANRKLALNILPVPPGHIFYPVLS